MEPKSPEITSNKPSTILKGNIIESAQYTHEIEVNADNVGANYWTELLNSSEADGHERNLLIFKNPLSNKFTPGKIITGSNTHTSTSLNEHGIKTFLSQVAVSIHTHPTSDENKHLQTLPPGDNDLQIIEKGNFGAGSMIVIDRSGAHLLIRTAVNKSESLPSDIIKKLAEEVKSQNGTTLDVQKKLNQKLNPYSYSYFFTNNITPVDGKVIFKKP